MKLEKFSKKTKRWLNICKLIIKMNQNLDFKNHLGHVPQWNRSKNENNSLKLIEIDNYYN